MKRMNKKGFTIVELVIVIAVIAILAAVLIPTFSSIITKADESAATQAATAAYKEAYALALADGSIADTEEITCENSWKVTFTASNGVISDVEIEAPSGHKYASYTYEWTSGVVKASKN